MSNPLWGKTFRIHRPELCRLLTRQQRAFRRCYCGAPILREAYRCETCDREELSGFDYEGSGSTLDTNYLGAPAAEEWVETPQWRAAKDAVKHNLALDREIAARAREVQASRDAFTALVAFRERARKAPKPTRKAPRLLRAPRWWEIDHKNRFTVADTCAWDETDRGRRERDLGHRLKSNARIRQVIIKPECPIAVTYTGKWYYPCTLPVKSDERYCATHRRQSEFDDPDDLDD